VSEKVLGKRASTGKPGNLRSKARDAVEQDLVRPQLVQAGTQSGQEWADEVRAVTNRAGIDDVLLDGGASYTEIVQTVDENGPPGSLILLSWKTCSGFAHGDWWTTKNASCRTQIPGVTQEGIGAFQIEANLSLLMQVTTLAVLMTSYGWRLHDQRCHPPF
jgi:hypothetical protein